MKQSTENYIREIFFRSMLALYAEDTPSLPGKTRILLTEGDYQVQDWCSKNTSSPVRVISILRKGMPVWMMQCGGWYEKRALPFLKKCLLKTYGAKRFYGGRGPAFESDGELTYTNSINSNSFDDFEGEDNVTDSDGTYLGEHWYRGIRLVA